MFKIDQSNVYMWPVTVHLPVDGGKHYPQTFDAAFKRLPQSRLEALLKGAQEGTTTDRDIATEALVGWRGVTSDGVELPFSETVRDQLFEIPGVATAVTFALFESVTGAKRKN